MTRKSNSSIVTALILFWFVLPSHAHAGDLKDELTLKVKAVAKFLKTTAKTNQLSLAPIEGPSFAGGIGFVGSMLESLLEEHGLELVANANHKLKLELIGDDPKGNDVPQGMLLEMSLKHRSGRKLREFSGEFTVSVSPAGAPPREVGVKVEKGNLGQSKIDNPDDTQRILSVPVATHDLDEDAESGGQEAKLRSKLFRLDRQREALNDPKDKTFIKGTRVSSTEAGVYQLELVRTNSTAPRPAASEYTPIPIAIDRETGFAMAELSKHDRIAVRFYNNGPERVAADIRIDGLSSFHFYRGGKLQPFYAIGKGKMGFVQGFMTGFDPSTKQGTYNHFKIVGFAESAWQKAQEAGFQTSTAQYGTIAVHVHREINNDKSGGENGFGFGALFTKQEQTTEMGIGAIIETIVIRYQKPSS